MAAFLLSAMPFTGHVTPLTAVAEALVSRGHDVRFYTGAAFRARVEAVGARFVPWLAASDFDENDLPATFPRLVGKKGFRQLFTNLTDCFIGTAPGQVTDLESEWARAPWDVIVGDEVSVGTALTAENIRTPWATIAVAPLNMAGTQGPPSGLGLAPGRTSLGRGRDAVLRAAVPVLARPLRGPLAAARVAAGLPPSSLTFEKAMFSPRLVLATGAPVLDYDRTDRPPHVRFIGRLDRPPSGGGALPPWWGDLEGRTAVHVTQGTQNIDPEDLIRPALEALADRDVIVVVTTGVRGRDTLPFPAPKNARVAGFIPHAALLPRTHVMITNGGWGGTLAALEQGVPLVVAGGDLDKPEVAARVAWSGAGVNLRTGTPTVAAVRDAYDRVASDAGYRTAAERIATALRTLGGAARAVELLESLIEA